MNLAPIVLFVYNRPRHTKRTVEYLKKNSLANQSDLIVFADGYKNEKDKRRVDEVRDYIKTIDGFKTITLNIKDCNIGLANSIISGVSDVVNKYGRVIVLEDDLETSPYFLQFMNEGLEKYEKDDRVASIHGYIYPLKGQLPETFFLRGADCWGWATWKESWDIFEDDSKKLIRAIKDKRLKRSFDVGNSYSYYRMLQKQSQGKVDSWAIRWYASVFLANKLTLYPGQSLINNFGFDDSGTHTKSSKLWRVTISLNPIKVSDIEVEDNRIVREKLKSFFSHIKYLGILYNLKSHAKIYVKKVFLTPSWHHIIINPYFIARRNLLSQIKDFASQHKTGNILDVGCGDRPYEFLFTDSQYTGIDIKNSGHNSRDKKVDCYYDGSNIPFESDSFDTVICTQVLEHTLEPQILMKDVYRVLRDGGTLFLTMPFVWDEHEIPYDFRRYTSYQHRRLLEGLGFKIETIKRTTGLFGTCGQLVSSFIFEIFKYKPIKIILAALVCFPIQLSAIFLDFIFFKKGITLDYIIICKK